MGTATASTTPSEVEQLSVIVVPHPDDEFEAWSLVENSSDNYKVFVVATTGEQTIFCEPDRLEVGLQEELGEVPPKPTPTGRWTSSCAAARMNSMLGFLTSMASSDPTLPGSWSAPSDRGPFPADGVQLCRTDDAAVETCSPTQRTARVWLDSGGRGAVVSWDLGDGDLTTPEVEWAVRTTIAQRATFALPTGLPVHNIVGSFSNQGDTCYSYTHPDHRAVHEALWSTTIPTGYRAAVTPASADAAFRVAGNGTRLGAHARYYGWLHRNYYPLDPSGQDQLFHSNQSFWIRRD